MEVGTQAQQRILAQELLNQPEGLDGDAYDGHARPRGLLLEKNQRLMQRIESIDRRSMVVRAFSTTSPVSHDEIEV